MIDILKLTKRTEKLALLLIINLLFSITIT